MRISIFVEHFPIPYKPYYDTQFAALEAAGHEVAIFAGGRLGRAVSEKVVRHRLLERTRYFPTTLRTVPRHLPAMVWSSLRAPRGAARVLSSTAGAPGTKRRFLEAARLLVTRDPEPDLCLVHGLITATLFPRLRQAHPGVPIAMYYHGGEVPSVGPVSDPAASAAFRGVDIVFTNTEFSRRQAVARGCPPDRVFVLPVGFALEDFRPPPDRPYRGGDVLRLLSAGRMSEEKGLIHALEAVKRLVDEGIRDVHYSLVGSGYTRPALERYVRENGLEPFVSFLGTLPSDRLVSLMGEVDALVLPSVPWGNWAETQACAVQEAMLMKAVVVTTTIGGVPESIPPEMRPFSVPPGDSAALAAAIRSVHGLDEPRMRSLGEAGRAFVCERYEIGRLNARMLELARSESPPREPVQRFTDRRPRILQA